MERDMGRIEGPTVPVRVDDHIRWGLGCSRRLALSLAAVARTRAEISAALAEWQEDVREREEER